MMHFFYTLSLVCLISTSTNLEAGRMADANFLTNSHSHTTLLVYLPALNHGELEFVQNSTLCSEHRMGIVTNTPRIQTNQAEGGAIQELNGLLWSNYIVHSDEDSEIVVAEDLGPTHGWFPALHRHFASSLYDYVDSSTRYNLHERYWSLGTRTHLHLLNTLQDLALDKLVFHTFNCDTQLSDEGIYTYRVSVELGDNGRTVTEPEILELMRSVDPSSAVLLSDLRSLDDSEALAEATLRLNLIGTWHKDDPLSGTLHITIYAALRALERDGWIELKSKQVFHSNRLIEENEEDA